MTIKTSQVRELAIRTWLVYFYFEAGILFRIKPHLAAALAK